MRELLGSGKEKSPIRTILRWLIVGQNAHSFLNCHGRHNLTRSISLDTHMGIPRKKLLTLCALRIVSASAVDRPM